ncbi:adenylate/guanylate cyclase domain-containing protein [Planoprotostelium fungivorum]|uniref:Adenylate/guanylate cyclase domain-containing protein n=1 Tax=Planoprotostelium fungivorum TaxID=1890364 RepID=A0A2P6N159_9EUKA|nr:adenylate/guanylate cyclase domain-containing protein [Planoprotostelium fungivorum]
MSVDGERRVRLQSPIFSRRQPDRRVNHAQSFDSTFTRGVSYSLYEKYLSEKIENQQHLELLKKRVKELDERLSKAQDQRSVLSANIHEEERRLSDLSLFINKNRISVDFFDRKLTFERETEQAENATVLSDKAETEQTLNMATNELTSIDARNRAFEIKLNSAQRETTELAGYVRGLKQENQTTLFHTKAQASEARICLLSLPHSRQIQEEMDTLQRQTTGMEAEIELMNEAQVALENYLSNVHSEMVSLASQLERSESSKFKPLPTKTENDSAAVGSYHPTGEVTVAFCDIEDAVILWENFSEVMILVIEIYNKILRDQLLLTGGYEVKSEAEIFMAAFSSPLDCLRWCHLVQEALLMASWPEKLLAWDKCSKKLSPDGRILFRGARVRMGFHMGYPEVKIHPVTRRVDYFGPDVNKTARIAGLAHGGQILTGERLGRQFTATPELSTTYKIQALGRYTLRGVGEDETIFQILPKVLADRSYSSLVNDGKDVNLQEKLLNRKRQSEEPGSPSITVEDDIPKPEASEINDVMKEVGDLVADIETTLKNHVAGRTGQQDNPQVKRKQLLSEEFANITAAHVAVKESIANYKKEKSAFIRKEKTLKEELVNITENKSILEERVRIFVKERLEKEIAIDKTQRNIERLVNMQYHMQQQISDIKRNKINITQKLKYYSNEVNETKLNQIREKMMALESELRRTEIYKELRGKHLRSLERLIIIVNGGDEKTLDDDSSLWKDSPRKPRTPLSAKRRINSAVTKEKEKPSDEGEEEDDIVSLQIQYEQTKKERELYGIHMAILEDYFKQLDEHRDPEELPVDLTEIEPRNLEKKDVPNLQEEKKYLLHQITVAKTERDIVKKQLFDLQAHIEAEKTRKKKALEKIQMQVDWAAKLHMYWRELIIKEFQNSDEDERPVDAGQLSTTEPAGTRKRVPSNIGVGKARLALEKAGEVDHQSILDMQNSIERQILAGSRTFDITNHSTYLKKVLQGEAPEIVLDNIHVIDGLLYSGKKVKENHRLQSSSVDDVHTSRNRAQTIAGSTSPSKSKEVTFTTLSGISAAREEEEEEAFGGGRGKGVMISLGGGLMKITGQKMAVGQGRK